MKRKASVKNCKSSEVLIIYQSWSTGSVSLSQMELVSYAKLEAVSGQTEPAQQG